MPCKSAKSNLTLFIIIMKKILRFSLLALLMTVFNGAWAAETPHKTLQFGAAYNSQGVSSYASSWFATYDDGFTFKQKHM